MKDIHSGMSLIGSIGPVTLSADNTPAAIDIRGFDGIELIFGVGDDGVTFSETDKLEIEVSHSDDNVSYSRPTADDFLGEVAVSDGTSGYSKVLAFIAAHATANVYRLGYVGGKRYLKILFNFSGTHNTGTPLFAIVLGMHPSVAPIAADAI